MTEIILPTAADWETVADEVADLVEAQETEYVSGIAEYVRDRASDYRDEQVDESEDE